MDVLFKQLVALKQTAGGGGINAGLVSGHTSLTRHH